MISERCCCCCPRCLHRWRTRWRRRCRRLLCGCAWLDRLTRCSMTRRPQTFCVLFLRPTTRMILCQPPPPLMFVSRHRYLVYAPCDQPHHRCPFCAFWSHGFRRWVPRFVWERWRIEAVPFGSPSLWTDG